MRLTAALAASALVVPPLHAQSPEDRSAIERLRDSLETITDTVTLIRMEQDWIAIARVDRDNTVLHLRLGFLALRLGELGGKDHFDDAASEFEWAVELEPEWPYAWYGLGLAERGLARNPGNLLFGVFAWLDRDQRTLAVDNFSEAARNDPAFVPALTSLAETTEGQEINRRPQVALDAFRNGLETRAAEDPLFQLYLGRLERSFGDVDRSLTAFKAYQDQGGTWSLGQLELARSAFLVDSLDGSEFYYDGAATDDSVTVAAYRTDLFPILSESDLTAFDGVAADERVEYLRTFWTTRDDEALQARGARIREHYHRLAVARNRFPRAPFMRQLHFGDYYQDNNTDFDDRGVIFVRHGSPTMRRPLIVPTSEAYGAEGWRYENADGNRDFYFLAMDDPYDYRLRATPLDLPLGNRTDFLQDFEPRLLTAGPGARSRYAQEVFIRGKENIVVGTTTDSYELRFERSVESIAQVVIAGASRDGNVVHVALAIAAGTLSPADSGGATYPITIRAIAADTAGVIVARVDSTVLRRLAERDSVTYLLERVSLAVPPGRLEIRVAVINGDGGGVFPRDTVEVLSAASSQPRMSPPVLGRRTPRIAWPHPATGDSVFFHPLETFQVGGDLEVYYELVGLSPGARYQTRIEVAKKGGGLIRSIFGGGGKKISLSFDQAVSGPVTPVHQTLGLEDLDTGTYRLTISLTGPDGVALEHERLFEVVD